MARRGYPEPVPVDDDIAIDSEATADAPAFRRSTRGFWLVTGAMVLGCVFIVVEIFANFGMKDTIAHAEFTLRTAQAAAERVHEADGTYAGADHTRLTVVETGFAQLPEDTYRKVYDGHVHGWASELGELAGYLDAP